MQVNPNAHWRDSARPVRFFFVDYRAMFPLVILLFVPRFWTIGVAVVAMIFFMILERYGFTVKVFMRLTRGFFGGPLKVARPWWYRTRT